MDCKADAPPSDACLVQEQGCWALASLGCESAVNQLRIGARQGRPSPTIIHETSYFLLPTFYFLTLLPAPTIQR